MSQEQVRKLEIAFAEARYGLSQQEATLDELRVRTGTIMGLFVVATSFFGARVIESQKISPAQITALALFLVVLSLLVSVVTVKQDWFFSTDISTNRVDALGDESLEVFLADLLEAFDEMARANEKKLISYQRLFNSSMYLLVLNMGVWVVAAIWRG